jgi:hypothetical protein
MSSDLNKRKTVRWRGRSVITFYCLGHDPVFCLARLHSKAEIGLSPALPFVLIVRGVSKVLVHANWNVCSGFIRVPSLELNLTTRK